MDELDKAAADDVGTPLAQVRDMAGVGNYFHLGRYEEALRHRTAVLESYDYEIHGHITNLTLHDPKVIALHWTGNVLQWILGYPDRALEEQREMLDHARRIGHPFQLIFALSSGSYGLFFRGDFDRLFEQCDEAAAIAHEESLLFAKFVLADTFRARAQVLNGDITIGIKTLEEGTALWESLGGELTAAESRATLAQGLHGLGRTDEALKLIDHALDRAEIKKERWALPDIYRVKGDLLSDSQSKGPHQAEGCYRKAIEIAQQQKAKSWELRGATGLARLWSAHGQRQKAIAVLEPIYEWFTEGFDTADLKDAKALLDKIS